MGLDLSRQLQANAGPLPGGVMATQQVLVLLFQVRVLAG